jgi:hypothetical protein
MKTARIALAVSLLLLTAACAHRGPMPCGCMPPPEDAPKQG